MVNREQLKRDCLRAYEFGRLRSAVRIVWVLVPTAITCALVTGASETCVCIGVFLLAGAVFLRWRNREGVASVRHGLVAGGLPLIVGLIVARVVPGWAGAPFASVCAPVCLGVGLASGAWLGLRLSHATTPIATGLSAIGVATLAASLGCVGLGFGGVVGAATGLLLGTASVLVVTRTSS